MKIFPTLIQEQLFKIATVSHTDLDMIDHLESSTSYVCALLVNKYRSGDRMVGGSTIEIREDINSTCRNYTISWWHRGEKCKGDVRIYNSGDNFITGDLQCDYLFY